MEQSRAEVRWGSTLNVALTGRGTLSGQKRLVQVDERYGRAWLMRYAVQVDRPLVVGEVINAVFSFSEGMGSAAMRYQRTLVINPTESENGPVSEWVSLVTMVVDVELVNSGLNDTASVTASAWISPASPVYPIDRRNER